MNVTGAYICCLLVKRSPPWISHQPIVALAYRDGKVHLATGCKVQTFEFGFPKLSVHFWLPPILDSAAGDTHIDGAHIWQGEKALLSFHLLWPCIHFLPWHLLYLLKKNKLRPSHLNPSPHLSIKIWKEPVKIPLVRVQFWHNAAQDPVKASTSTRKIFSLLIEIFWYLPDVSFTQAHKCGSLVQAA